VWRAIPVLVANAAVWVMAIMMWDGLPERIPLHFDFHGVPDRWGAPSAANWLGMAILSSVMSLLMGGGALCIGWLARHVPQIVNVPDKPLWLALPAEARVRSLAPVRALLVWIGTGLNCLFGAMLASTAAVAKGTASTMPWWPILGLIVATLVGVAIAMLRTRQRIRMEVAIAGLPS
jgi:uncharacterized membrane protein